MNMLDEKDGYTEELYESIPEIVRRDIENDYEDKEILEKINDPDFIRLFHKRLLSFYNNILGADFTADEAAKDLLRRANQKNISLLKRGTVNNWFSGSRTPDYGDDDRKRLFAVAFALELDVDQTARLFHKVFLDISFKIRSPREFIYLHCIYNKKPLSAAADLISRLDGFDGNETLNEQTEQTRFLLSFAVGDTDGNNLLDFIKTHPKNFSLSNTAAKKQLKTILDRLTGSADKPGLAHQEYERRRLEKSDDKDDKDGFDGRTPASDDFLLYMIMDMDFAQRGNADITPIRDIFSRKEIYNQFPDKQTFSMPHPSSYVLRKEIILLKFYEYWVNNFLTGNKSGSYDGFVSHLNDILENECGLSPLYLGNPYDWLFLYCSACGDEYYTPLDRVRGMMAPV
jgi:hypothetical protein